MNTNFFTNISELLVKQDITIKLVKVDPDKDEITVGVWATPRINDDSKENIPSLNIRGSVSDLNEGFFEAINKPLSITKQYATDLGDFEKKMSEAKAKSKMAEEEKKKAKAQKEKEDKILKKAQELFDKGDYKDVVAEVNKVLGDNSTNEKALKLKKSASEKLSTVTLF